MQGRAAMHNCKQNIHLEAWRARKAMGTVVEWRQKHTHRDKLLINYRREDQKLQRR